MTAPDRIAVYWTAVDEDTMPARLMAQTPRSPIFDEDLPKSQRIEYVRADLVDPAAIREAAIRECAEKVRAVVDAWAKAPVEDFHPEDPDRPDLMGEAVKLLHSIAPSILALIPKGAADDRA